VSLTTTPQALHQGRAPTGVRELSPARAISPVPERHRVSVVGSRTQVDITLPADARIADVLPYLSGLIAQRENGGQDPATLRGETTRRHVLSRERDGAALDPDQTLRSAGVRSGDMLYVRTERTLQPPTLHDDVVDAAAQLNRTAYAGWGPGAAAVMAGIALYAGVAILIWMSLDSRFVADRAAVGGIQAVVVVALLATAAAANRFHGAGRAAAMFGWSALPLTVAAAWVPLSAWRPWGLPALCVTAVVLSYLAYRLVGGAVWGFLAGAEFACGAGILAVAAHPGTGLEPKPVAAVVATALVFASALIPRYRGGRPPMAGGQQRDARPGGDLFADPFGTDRDEPPADVRATLPTAEAVLAHERSATTVRSALYTGLSAAVVLSVVVLLWPWTAPRWPDLAFAGACAAALGLRARFCRTTIERLAPASGAVAVMLVGCATALAGPPPYAITGAAVLLLGVAAAVWTGLTPGPGSALRSRRDTLLAYADYLVIAALVPLALAVSGFYARLGGT
jgi:type VII secretion integral membrane protein EccD